MTSATTIIQAAYREGNLIPAGTQPTANEQNEAVVLLANFILGVFGEELGENLVDWLVPAPQRTAQVAANFPQLPFPTDTLGDVWPLPFAPDLTKPIFQFPPKNSRIVFGNVASTVYFPEAPEDGSRMEVVQGTGAGDGGTPGAQLTLDGNGRFIQDITGANPAATQVLTAPITTVAWMYRSDLATWVTIKSTLALGDTIPFPASFDDLWGIMLFIRLAPRYSKTVSKETDEAAMKMLKKLKARYRQSGVTVYGSSDFPRSLQSYISGRWWW